MDSFHRVVSLSHNCPCRFRIPAVSAAELMVTRRLPETKVGGSTVPPRNHTFIRVYLESAADVDTPAIVWLALPRPVVEELMDLFIGARGKAIVNLGRVFTALRYGEKINTHYAIKMQPASKTDKLPAALHALITNIANSLSPDLLPGTTVAAVTKDPAMPLPSIFKVTSKGLCLGAESIILAPTPARAMELHKQHTGCEKDMDVEEQQASVDLEIGGKPVTEHVFHADNGDQ